VKPIKRAMTPFKRPQQSVSFATNPKE
jgi:hypothetical protein